MLIIVGATSAIGRGLAREYAASGMGLVLCARNKESLEPLVADIKLRYGVSCVGALYDAQDDAESFISRVEKKHKSTGMILCQGSMDSADGVGISQEGIANIIRVNYHSVVALCVAYARVSKGFIAVVGSVAGERGKARNLVYSSAKGAVSTFLEGFRLDVENVVVEIRPGFVDSRMTWGYIDSPLIASREYVARKIKKAIAKRKKVVYVPFFWKYIMLIIRNISGFIYSRMKL